MSSVFPTVTGADCAVRPCNFTMDAADYWADAAQRWALFVDVLAERGSRYREHAAKAAPHVLKFECSLVMDGRKLPRPVNYALVRIAPPAGVKLSETRRPFVVIDPRAGHGPGIGGVKAGREIGVAPVGGEPPDLIRLLPEPVTVP